MVGLLLAFVAFVVALSEFSPVEKASLTPLVSLNTHATIGIFVMVLGMLQPLNAFFRPHPSPMTMHRKMWNILHWTSGWVATALGMINCIVGACASTATSVASSESLICRQPSNP